MQQNHIPVPFRSNIFTFEYHGQAEEIQFKGSRYAN